MFAKIEAFIHSLDREVEKIAPERQEKLRQLAQYCREQISEKEVCDLTFICTHNSRRSHMSQIWARTMAAWHQVSLVRTWSGGTIATAFHPNAIKAMEDAGFFILPLSDGENPHYRIQFSQEDPGKEVWSKAFSDKSNPQTQFAAIMTCTDADEACPFVPGANFRLSLPFDDPKHFDGSPQQDEKYRERSRQIAAEMCYVFEQAKL